jgi:hypothetical protein
MNKSNYDINTRTTTQNNAAQYHSSRGGKNNGTN